ncbi:peptide chain release factor N(5)-glutamine methyltransferase [Parvularcula sp. LCG005]|uniref:peptide chain release factor N(5)-glutamine methyltransferase n=1 Tax=Parvularcula sp. LCG005 TaxID=3078805 RepID=UPI002941CA4B|nr:peptide chain release factor N(5)-glutamine methyltransferase [Parvularcula sp. LCG005]WOI52003.1 peptide chain release factor N(5)-glutamine methyltransferase [Parvularcula sp. LCG005]
MATYGQSLRQAAQGLSASPTPALDARLLLLAASGLDHAGLIAADRDPVDPAVEGTFSALVARRMGGEPIAYILGEQEFYGRRFRVGPDVLIPRPETEMLIDAALRVAVSKPRIADLGLGSGCILGTLLAEIPEATGLGVDLSPAALGVAAANLTQLAVRSRAALAVRSFEVALPGVFDLIVSNPPYIEAAAVLPVSVAEHEPAMALFAGQDGLDAYRALAPIIAGALAPDGHAFLEIGDGQGAAVSQLMQAVMPDRPVTLNPDLAGRERLVSIAAKA